MDSQCWGNSLKNDGCQRNAFGRNSAQILWSDIPRDKDNYTEMFVDDFSQEEPVLRSPGDSLYHPHIPYMEMKERSLVASRESVLDRNTSIFQTYKGKKRRKE